VRLSNKLSSPTRGSHLNFLLQISLALSIIFLSTGVVQAANQTLWQSNQSFNNRLKEANESYYQLDRFQLEQLLSKVQPEGDSAHQTIEVQLPVGGGELEHFGIVESPVMQSGLASRYPEIRTYKIHGIDNPHASGRISLTSSGLHGMITSPEGSFFINPQGQNNYRAFKKNNHETSPSFGCDNPDHNHLTPAGKISGHKSLARKAGQLKVYRIAIAATEDFVDASGGTRGNTMVRVVNVINRVNEIYERDLGIRLQLVDNTDNLFFKNGDSYGNGSSQDMADENQKIVTGTIGAANYDIGHLFGTGGGGFGYYGVVCNDSWKAKGVSNGFHSSGDESAIDLVAHEIGHQFNARHTFNGTTNYCGGNRSAGSAYEPGSGSTIMAYSGYCGAENIQYETDVMFHAKSIETIDNFTTSGYGASCANLVDIDNLNQPSVNAGSNFVIPISTAFVLSAAGIDADGDALSYTWDQIDNGHATDKKSFGTDMKDNPLMRSLLPRSTRSRFFPQLQSWFKNSDSKAETLPTRDRRLKFRVSVRDGKGGYNTDDTIITAESDAGPFRINSHNNPGDLSGGDTQTISWEVANTDRPPVNCNGVDIDLLMLDVKNKNYCVEPLVSDAPNIGNATVTLPDLSMPNARFRVSCSDNIFYALSTANLKITGASAADTSCLSIEVESEILENPSSSNGDSGDDASGSGNNSGGSGGGGAIGHFLFILLAFSAIRRKVLESSTIETDSLYPIAIYS